MENKKKEKKISKSISYWLRHSPHSIGIEIAHNGWTDIETLIENAAHKVRFTFDELKCVVYNDDKNRFSISDDGTQVRANTGHSVKVELDMKEIKPPMYLYHGTSESSLKSILKEGLTPQKRHHVHMSPDIETAKIVANRRSGKKVILKISSMKMRADNNKIYFLNNIYFSDKVSPEFISILEKYS